MWYTTWWGITIIIVGSITVIITLSFIFRKAPVVGPLCEAIAEIACAVVEAIGDAADDIGSDSGDIADDIGSDSGDFGGG